jgi:hypothetical protein
MWTYRQSTGEIFRDGVLKGHGYSGHGEGKNNPAMQHIKCVGPIPVGRYHIGEPYKSLKLGPLVLPLTPVRTNNMHGRSGFAIHGESAAHPGEASLGCIIQDYRVRQTIYDSEDKVLEVIV